MKKKVVIFGASDTGELVYNKIKNKYDVIYFCDNDKKKINSLFCDIKVIDVAHLIDSVRTSDIKVIIASKLFYEIGFQLYDLGIDDISVAFIIHEDGNIEEGIKYEVEIEKFNFKHLSSIEPKDNSIGLIVRNNSGSNTLALWKEMPKKISNVYNVKLIKEDLNSIKYYEQIFSCRTLITTHANNIYSVKLGRQNLNKIKLIQLWHGFPMKGMSKMDKSNHVLNNKFNWDMYDAVISYSSLYSTLLNACFGGNANIYKLTGMPRNDLLFNSNGREKLSEIFNINLENKKVVFYMPTFRRNFRHKRIAGNKNWDNIFGFSEFDNERFNYFLKKNNIIFIIKMHPYEEIFVNKMISEQGNDNIKLLKDEILNKNELDLYELVNSCDLLITDYSSIYYDYLLLDRPIIFTPVDLDEYIESTGMLYGPYEFWTPGPKALSQEKLCSNILENLSNPQIYSKERDTIRNIVHYYKDNNSSVRVWKLIDEICRR